MAPAPSAVQQFVRSLNLDLTRTAEISFNQLTVGAIPPITSAMIQDLSITDADISPIADIDGSKILVASIPIDKMANVGSQTFQDYVSSIASPAPNTITSGMIVNGAILNEDISNSTITGAKIANETITSANILDGTILNIDISNGTITGAKIASGTITSDNIQDGTIGNSDISESANIRWYKITATNSILNTDISDSTITGSKIASNTITSDNILDGTILNTDISNGTITGSKIASNTITSDNILDGTILNTDISNGTITGSKIASNTITSNNIQNGTILDEDISNNTITGSKIAYHTITTLNIQDGTIENSDISSTADIEGSKIQAATSLVSGVVSTVLQKFAGEKIFTEGINSSQDVSRSAGSSLDNPLPVLYTAQNSDPLYPFGYIDALVQNTNTTSPTNFVVIQIPIDVSTSAEVSSYFEVTLLGSQKIVNINLDGTQVDANPEISSTTRCLITVTGVEVTTTFLGKKSLVGPIVTTKILQSSPNYTTNLLIGIGFQNFTAYHIKGVRSGAEPRIFFQTSNTPVGNQNDADTLFASDVLFP
jgi:hypothetical protein